MLRNHTYHRRREERLRREDHQRTVNRLRDQALMRMAQATAQALISGTLDLNSDRARGDGLFAFPPATPSGSAH